MHIAILLVAPAVIFGLTNVICGELPQYKRISLLVGSLTTWMAIALRHPNSSPDLQQYVSRYRSLPFVNIRQIASGDIAAFDKDPAFWVLAKACSVVGMNERAWIAALAAILCGACAILINRHTSSPLTAFTVVIYFGYAPLFSTALRQSVALALTLLASYYLLERRKVLGYGLFLVASLFHGAMLLCLPAAVLARRRPRWALCSLVAMLAMSLARPDIFRSAISYFGWTESITSYADTQTGLTWSAFAFHALVLAVATMLHGKTSRISTSSPYVYNISLIGIGFFALSTQVAESFRIASALTIYEMLYLSNMRLTPWVTSPLNLTPIAVAIIGIAYSSYSGAYTPYVENFAP
ncbi:EpsG family protein [Janibacter hoylei]|uniref:EpsG family protein n=1 Tax=Janibacter hoylei TaxID=364298 RepID=UPI0024906C29|nr:EpsG family protein [Janibacter hoylei]